MDGFKKGKMVESGMDLRLRQLLIAVSPCGSFERERLVEVIWVSYASARVRDVETGDWWTHCTAVNVKSYPRNCLYYLCEGEQEKISTEYERLGGVVEERRVAYREAREERERFYGVHRVFLDEVERREKEAAARMRAWRKRMRRRKIFLAWRHQHGETWDTGQRRKLAKEFGLNRRGFNMVIFLERKEELRQLETITNEVGQMEAIYRKYPHLWDRALDKVCDGT